MIAEFYIVNHSFRSPENVDIETIEEKIKLLSEDYLYIRQYKETDKIFVHPSIYEECIYEDLTIEEFLYSRKWKAHFDRDTQEYLRIIIDHSEQTDIILEEILEVLLPDIVRKLFMVYCVYIKSKKLMNNFWFMIRIIG